MKDETEATANGKPGLTFLPAKIGVNWLK
jgi:hypothetical protein